MNPARTARSRIYRLHTRLPDRLRDPLRALQWTLGRGPIEIAGGLTRHGLLAQSAVPLDHVQAYGLVRGTLEIPVQEALRRVVPAGGVVYDVGANVGFFTLLSARLVADHGRVVAFEPSPRALEGLRQTVALNALANVTVVASAVAASPGRAALLEVSQHSWSHLADRGPHPQATAVIDVDVTSVDEVVRRGTPPPDVVKIDVEGSETAVLEGMAATLREHAPALVVELHETNDEVVDLLDAHGYVAENLDGSEPVRQAGPTHILARRGDASDACA